MFHRFKSDDAIVMRRIKRNILRALEPDWRTPPDQQPVLAILQRQNVHEWRPKHLRDQQVGSVFVEGVCQLAFRSSVWVGHLFGYHGNALIAFSLRCGECIRWAENLKLTGKPGALQSTADGNGVSEMSRSNRASSKMCNSHPRADLREPAEEVHVAYVGAVHLQVVTRLAHEVAGIPTGTRTTAELQVDR